MEPFEMITQTLDRFHKRGGILPATDSSFEQRGLMDGTRVSVKPLWVRMQGENRPFSAGTTYEIGCEIVGARPNPKITWSKGSLMLRNARQTVKLTFSRCNKI